MKKLTFILFIALVALSCNKIDSKKFDGVSKAFIKINNATEIGVSSYPEYEALLKNFETEISLIKSSKLNDNEDALLSSYKSLLYIYSDVYTLWSLKFKSKSVVCETKTYYSYDNSIEVFFIINKYELQKDIRIGQGVIPRFVDVEAGINKILLEVAQRKKYLEIES